MDRAKVLALLYIILGLIFIIYPMLSADVVSVIIGLSLIFFGISTLILELQLKNFNSIFLIMTVLISIISILFGIIFMFYIDALSFIIGFQFYLVGFIMVLTGIIGIIFRRQFALYSSILILIIGTVSIALGLFSVSQPVFIATLVGIVLIIEGISLWALN